MLVCTSGGTRTAVHSGAFVRALSRSAVGQVSRPGVLVATHLLKHAGGNLVSFLLALSFGLHNVQLLPSHHAALREKAGGQCISASDLGIRTQDARMRLSGRIT